MTRSVPALGEGPAHSSLRPASECPGARGSAGWSPCPLPWGSAGPVVLPSPNWSLWHGLRPRASRLVLCGWVEPGLWEGTVPGRGTWEVRPDLEEPRSWNRGVSLSQSWLHSFPPCSPQLCPGALSTPPPSPCGAAALPSPPWRHRGSTPGPGPLYEGLDFRSWVLVSPVPHCLGDRAVSQSQGPGPAGTVAACAGHHGTKAAAGAGSCADQREDEAFPPSLGQAPCGLAVAASRVLRPSLLGWGLRRLSRGPRDRARGAIPAAAIEMR